MLYREVLMDWTTLLGLLSWRLAVADHRHTILFVGESPPAGAPPNFRPFDCASGSRLAKALGLVDRAALLDNVPFTNVFPTPTGVRGCPPWSAPAATLRGHALRQEHAGASIVAL